MRRALRTFKRVATRTRVDYPVATCVAVGSLRCFLLRLRFALLFVDARCIPGIDLLFVFRFCAFVERQLVWFDGLHFTVPIPRFTAVCVDYLVLLPRFSGCRSVWLRLRYYRSRLNALPFVTLDCAYVFVPRFIGTAAVCVLRLRFTVPAFTFVRSHTLPHVIYVVR